MSRVRSRRPTAACGWAVDVWATETKPSLIGTEWHRREPLAEDDGWNSVRVVGVQNLGEAGGGLELVIAPAVFGDSPVCATPESFAEAYTQEAPNESTAALRARLERLR